MKKILLLVSICLASCGGGGTSEDTPDVTTRNLSGSFQGVAHDVSVLPKASSLKSICSTDAGVVCKVVATPTEGDAVYDDDLTDCSFLLSLTISESYVLSVMAEDPETGNCDTFLATVKDLTGIIFDIEEGDPIDLDVITIDSGYATFSGSFDGVVSCSEAGYNDVDEDGICDDWDDLISECTENTECLELYESDKPICDDGTCRAVAVNDLAGSYVIVGEESVSGCSEGFNYLNFPQTETAAAVDENTVTITGDDAPDGILCTHTEVSINLSATDAGFDASEIVLGCPEADPETPDNGETTNTITFDVTEFPFTLTRVITDEMESPFAADCTAVYTKE